MSGGEVMRQLVAIIAMMACAACAKAEKPRPDFRPALDAHLAALTAKDLDAYKSTITSGDDLMIIFPEGEVIEPTNSVLKFHEEWFQDSDWRMDLEVQKIMEGADMAAALLKYDFRDTADGEPRSAWLMLLFKLENGEWRLIHDQNTRIKQNTSSETE